MVEFLKPEVLESLLVFQKQQTAAILKESLGFNGFVQVLNGKKGGEHLNNRVFWLVVGNMLMEPEKWSPTDPLLAAKRSKQFNEAVANYFQLILSKQEKLTFTKAEMLEPMLLSIFTVQGENARSDLQRAFHERGVIEGFRQVILNFTPNDDLAMIALSLFMVHNCHFWVGCLTLKDKDSEQAISAVARCFHFGQVSIPEFLRIEPLFSLVRIISQARIDPKLAPVVTQGLILYDLGGTMLRDLVPTYSNMFGFSMERLLEARLLLFSLPKFIPTLATSELYLEFVLEHFRKKNMMMKEHQLFSHGDYVIHLNSCRDAMGEKLFLEKFLPKLVKVWPEKFLEEVYTWGASSCDQLSLMNYISTAATFHRAGQFHGYQKLTNVVVELYRTGNPWLMYSDLQFLRKVYGIPDFNPEMFKKVKGCTEEMLTDIYSILSFVLPETNEVIQEENLIMTLDVKHKKIKGEIIGVMTTGFSRCLKCNTKFQTSLGCKNCGPGKATDQTPISKDLQIPIVSYPKNVSKAKAANETASLNPKVQKNSAVAKPDASKNSSFAAAFKANLVSGLNKKDDALFTCDSCGLKGNNLLMCGRCQCTYYCNQDCQRAGWKKGHKQACKTLADARTSKT